MYPVIVSKNDLNTPLAYLNNIQDDDCTISKSINGEDTLSFTAIIEELKTDFLYDENNLILVDDDLYKPLVLEEEHHDNGLLTISVDCEHISYELLNKIMLDFSYANSDIATVINACLLGTDFILAGTDVTLKTDINYTDECNARQILIAIANNWKAELKFNKYNIYAYKQIGENRGVDFRFGKNLKSIRRTVDRSNKDSNGNPAISYDVDVVNLALAGGEYAELEYFELGDTVRIVDEALNIEVQQRIIELEKDVLTGKNTNLVLGAIDDDLRQTVSGLQNNVNNVTETVTGSAPDWNKIKDITDNLGNVIAAKIAGTLELAATQIENSTTTMEITDNGILFHNQPTEAASTFACLLNSTGILFANSKDSQGNWEWQTAINADGVTATKILASALYGLTIEAVTITGGTINGGTINGVTMEGSTIYAGDRQSGNYTAITQNGSIIGYRNNVAIFEYQAGNSIGRLTLADSDNQDHDFEITAVFDVPIGSGTATAKASRLWSGCSRILIGGDDTFEMRIELYGKRIMTITDNDVTIDGDLTVTGTINN